jgi:hypothetical protein
MANELMQAGSTLLSPWTNYSLRALETMVAWQQQMLEQWFRMLNAWTPPGTVPADPVNALQIAGTAEAATPRSARPQAARVASTPARQSVAASERPQAQNPRRAPASKPKRRSRRA